MLQSAVTSEQEKAAAGQEKAAAATRHQNHSDAAQPQEGLAGSPRPVPPAGRPGALARSQSLRRRQYGQERGGVQLATPDGQVGTRAQEVGARAQEGDCNRRSSRRAASRPEPLQQEELDGSMEHLQDWRARTRDLLQRISMASNEQPSAHLEPASPPPVPTVGLPPEAAVPPHADSPLQTPDSSMSWLAEQRRRTDLLLRGLQQASLSQRSDGSGGPASPAAAVKALSGLSDGNGSPASPAAAANAAASPRRGDVADSAREQGSPSAASPGGHAGDRSSRGSRGSRARCASSGSLAHTVPPPWLLSKDGNLHSAPRSPNKAQQETTRRRVSRSVSRGAPGPSGTPRGAPGRAKSDPTCQLTSGPRPVAVRS